MKSSRSIVSLFDNTGYHAKRPSDELQCMCAAPIASTMLTLSGHVCQPLLPWVQRFVHLPSTWNGKSKCKPDVWKSLEGWEEAIEGLDSRILSRFRRTISKKPPCLSAGSDLLAKVFERSRPKSPVVDVCALAPLLPKLAGFVRSPLDKNSTEGLIQ